MQRKPGKSVCVILAVILFLSGMLFEENQLDVPFVCTPIERATSCLQADYDTIMEEDLATAEMLENQSNCTIRQLAGNCMRSKGGLRISLAFLCPDVFQLQKEKFFTGSEITSHYGRYLDELIINYIHSSDGKKRS